MARSSDEDEATRLERAARAAETAQARLDALAKPPGALAGLEQLAIWVARASGEPRPRVDRARVVVFAADHGVAAAHPISAYPRAVTAAMRQTFAAERACVSAIARAHGAECELVDVGVAAPPTAAERARPALVYAPVDPRGSADWTTGPALTAAAGAAALAAGAAAVERAVEAGVDLLAIGELGIGNTSTAAALACAALELDPDLLVGPGTGLSPAATAIKAQVVRRGLARIAGRALGPFDLLCELGGLELAAIAGALDHAERRGVPVLLDGVVTLAAAWIAVARRPAVRRVLWPATRSPEPAFEPLRRALELPEPIFSLGLRLGEGSGAALAIGPVRAACALLSDVATLAEVLALPSADAPSQAGAPPPLAAAACARSPRLDEERIR